MARAGIDFQLHTHRHRTPLDRDRFVGEIRENRAVVEEMTGSNERVHFCYPSGALAAGIPSLAARGRRAIGDDLRSTALAARGDSDQLSCRRLLDQYGCSTTSSGRGCPDWRSFMPQAQERAAGHGAGVDG